MANKTYECKKCDIEFESQIQTRTEDLTPAGGCLKWVVCDVCQTTYCLKTKGPKLSLKPTAEKPKP